jgi:hypothetical protein
MELRLKATGAITGSVQLETAGCAFHGFSAEIILAVWGNFFRQVSLKFRRHSRLSQLLDERDKNTIFSVKVIFPRFNGHQHLTDEVSNAKIHKAQKDVAILK